MLNIVIPCAGKGQRFRDAGYTTPKPFIKVHGRPMIRLVVENLVPKDRNFRVILVCLPEHEEMLKKEFPGATVIIVGEPTRGAACTALHAREFIDNNDSLLVASCDQVIDWEQEKFYRKAHGKDGMIVTYKATEPYHSFCQVEKGKVVKIAEKEVISDNANIGLYYFGSGEDFITAAENMIDAEDTFKDEFYLSKIYNHLINLGKKNIEIYEVPRETCHILGTPVTLRRYIK